jgi:hypothetical protein
VWRSSGVSVRGWRRTGQGALVACSGAGGARDCGCGVAEVADNGEQRLRRSGGDGGRVEKKPRNRNVAA